MTATFFIWQWLVILTSSACGVAVCRRTFARHKNLAFETVLNQARPLYITIGLLLLLPIASVYLTANPELHWDLPWMLQLHYTTIHWAAISGILGYLFGFCCTAGFVMRRRGRWATATLAMLTLSAIQAYAWWKGRSDLPALPGITRSRDGVILQSCNSTCVPASGVNIAAILGVRTTEEELVKLFRTTRNGTYPAQAIVGLKQLGIAGRKLTVTGADIGAVKAPAMLFVLGDVHAVVYVGTSNGLVEIWDPASGKRFLSERRLRNIWQGHALEFRRAP